MRRFIAAAPRTTAWAISLVASVSLAGVSLAGCSELDDDEGPVRLEEIPLFRQGTIPVGPGFSAGRPIELYDFGGFLPAEAGWFPAFEEFPGMPVNPIYVFVDESGAPIASQKPIIDHLPKQAGYSDFLEIVEVTAGGDYRDNQIKSFATLIRIGEEESFTFTPTGKVINCPVVGPDAELAPPVGKALWKTTRLELWFRKQSTHCLLADGGEALLEGGAPALTVFSAPVGDRTELRVPAREIYLLAANVFGGEDRVSAVPVPNNAIVRYPPDATEYSPLSQAFRVTVPSDYVIGQLTSYDDLFPVPDFTDPRIEELSPQVYINAPMIAVGDPGSN